MAPSCPIFWIGSSTSPRRSQSIAAARASLMSFPARLSTSIEEPCTPSSNNPELGAGCREAFPLAHDRFIGHLRGGSENQRSGAGICPLRGPEHDPPVLGRSAACLASGHGGIPFLRCGYFRKRTPHTGQRWDPAWPSSLSHFPLRQAGQSSEHEDADCVSPCMIESPRLTPQTRIPSRNSSYARPRHSTKRAGTPRLGGDS